MLRGRESIIRFDYSHPGRALSLSLSLPHGQLSLAGWSVRIMQFAGLDDAVSVLVVFWVLGLRVDMLYEKKIHC